MLVQIYTRSHFSVVVVYRYMTSKQHQQRQKKKNCIVWFLFVSCIDVCADCVYDFFHASCHCGVRFGAFDVSRFVLMAHDNILKCQYTLKRDRDASVTAKCMYMTAARVGKMGKKQKNRWTHVLHNHITFMLMPPLGLPNYLSTRMKLVLSVRTGIEFRSAKSEKKNNRNMKIIGRITLFFPIERSFNFHMTTARVSLIETVTNLPISM